MISSKKLKQFNRCNPLCHQLGYGKQYVDTNCKSLWHAVSRISSKCILSKSNWINPQLSQQLDFAALVPTKGCSIDDTACSPPIELRFRECYKISNIIWMGSGAPSSSQVSEKARVTHTKLSAIPNRFALFGVNSGNL